MNHHPPITHPAGTIPTHVEHAITRRLLLRRLTAQLVNLLDPSEHPTRRS